MDTQELKNELDAIERKVGRIRSEYRMGGPDLEMCDSLLKDVWSSVGRILKERKERGWPLPGK